MVVAWRLRTVPRADRQSEGAFHGKAHGGIDDEVGSDSNAARGKGRQRFRPPGAITSKILK